MSKKTLIPRTIINSQGKLAYSEGFQAWNTIRLKKELFSEFPELKEKRSKFSYQLMFHRTIEEFENAVKQLKKSGAEILPLLLFLYKEG